jgi:hypothetical protein
MRTFRYHREVPEGKIFDTEPNMPDPQLPSNWESLGWKTDPGQLQMTQEDVVEAAVKAELARQDSDRPKMEREILKRTGMRVPATMSDKSAKKLL